MRDFLSLSPGRLLLLPAALVLSSFLSLTPASAQLLTHPIGLQGLFLDGTGALLTGSYDLHPKLYHQPETRNVVRLEDQQP